MYMARRTIQSPGVEINEIDLSLRPADKIGTNIFVTGFAPQGPNDEIVQVSSLSEFTQIYGLPTNSAERYFYHTVAQSFNSRANIIVNRLPYGAGLGDGFTNKYFATVYPVIPINKTVYDDIGIGGTTWSQTKYLTANIDQTISATDAQFSPASAGNEIVYCLGKPTFITLSQSQYVGIANDSVIDWSNDATVGNPGYFTVNNNRDTVEDQVATLRYAGLIVLNTAKTTINQRLEGYYTAITDNTNLYSSTDYDDITRFTFTTNETENVTQYSDLYDIPSSRLNFVLSADYNSEAVPSNISETQESIPSFQINTKYFNDTLVFGLYKLRTSVFSPQVTKLDYLLEEGYAGSIDSYRQINSANGGAPVSFYLPQKLSNESVNMLVKINPYISGRRGTVSGESLNIDGTPKKTIRVINNQLIDNIYTGGDEDVQYANIVGLSSGDVSDISEGQSIKSGSGIGGGVVYLRSVVFGMGDAAAIPAAKYSTTIATNNVIGDISGKLDRVFDRLANVDLFDIDIVPEGGLGTIFTTVRNSTVPYNVRNSVFDDRDALIGISGLSATSVDVSLPTAAAAIRNDWNTIQTKFINFAQYVRKDFIFISDPIRQVLITGDNQKGINTPGSTFPLNILAPLKQIYSVINTNYAAAYAAYAQVYDSGVGGQIWIPFSGIAAAKYAQTDANFAPWYAPAGFTRGLINVNDITLYPNQKQRDSLFDQVNINPVAFFPSEGFVIFAQKTLQSQPSAFDRINVRRLFLYLEKRTRQTVKYFVFEPNTLFTRTNVINVLSPIFEDAKNNEGLYDYMIVCDERNNTPTVIDANELIVDIYLKPVRAAEYILVNFYATRTGQDFSELVN